MVVVQERQWAGRLVSCQEEAFGGPEEKVACADDGPDRSTIDLIDSSRSMCMFLYCISVCMVVFRSKILKSKIFINHLYSVLNIVEK